MNNFPVDIVYTWVNGSDKNWLQKKNDTLKKYSNFHKKDEVSGNARFYDRDELKYSLRSISKFAKWIRNIFIITDNQIPEWLNLNHSKIKVIDHKDIFKNEHLPSFNSNAIESNIHNIKELSNNFLSFNDDFFLGRNTSILDFYHKNGNCKIFSGNKLYLFNKKNLINKNLITINNPHQAAIFNARLEIYKKYNYVVNYNLRHGIKVLNKQKLINLELLFPNSLEVTRKNQFRDNTDIWIIALEAFNSIAERNNVPFLLKPYRKISIKHNFKYINKYRDYIFIPLNLTTKRIKRKLEAIKNYKPLMFCINDYPGIENNKYQLIRNFLSEFYNNKSEFEK